MTTGSINLDLDAETDGRLKRLAEARRCSRNSLMQEAIAQYLEREEKRERLRQDAFAAWDEYQATGQHVTADEADAWLAELELGEDSGPPTAHD